MWKNSFQKYHHIKNDSQSHMFCLKCWRFSGGLDIQNQPMVGAPICSVGPQHCNMVPQSLHGIIFLYTLEDDTMVHLQITHSERKENDIKWQNNQTFMNIVNSVNLQGCNPYCLSGRDQLRRWNTSTVGGDLELVAGITFSKTS